MLWRQRCLRVQQRGPGPAVLLEGPAGCVALTVGVPCPRLGGGGGRRRHSGGAGSARAGAAAAQTRRGRAAGRMRPLRGPLVGSAEEAAGVLCGTVHWGAVREGSCGELAASERTPEGLGSSDGQATGNRGLFLGAAFVLAPALPFREAWPAVPATPASGRGTARAILLPVVSPKPGEAGCPPALLSLLRGTS